MKSKCCNKPLRLSRENPEPGETMYYICDGCNQPADPKCDHGDHILCNECMEPAGLDQAQLHADDRVDSNYPEEEREKLITQLMVWTYTQTLSREQLQHKGCGNHNGTNECCRNETLELVRTKLNQLKGNHD